MLMFKSKYVFTFILITFCLLSITGAGIFLDDEWVSAQQLRQLGEGHQIITNEGGYGYYENGTSGKYFEFRSNRLMYSMALPIAAFPVYEFIKFTGDYFRFIIISIWMLLGIFILLFLHATSKLTKFYVKIGIGSIIVLTLINLYLYTTFPVNEFAPSELLAITITNIILFGLFSVVLYKIINRLYDNDRLKLFSFIATISCTSLIFWATTCKDHMLSAVVGLLILYYLIKYTQDKSMSSLSIALFLTGLLTWIRIEYGIGLTLGIAIYLLIFHYRNVLSNIIILSISFVTGTIPLWVNNYIITGSPLVHPFTLANAAFAAGLSYEEEMAIFTMKEELRTNILVGIFKFLFSPSSGAVGLAIVIPLVLIIIPAYIMKRVKLSQTDILLLTVSFSSVIYYLIVGSVYMSIDTGIMPDMRYFIVFYTPIILFTISLLSKILPDLKYKKIIIYYILSVGLIVILLTTFSATISDDGTYREMNRIVNTATIALAGIGIIALINDIRLNKNYLTYILPIIIAIPMAWQLVMVFIYHSSKANAYPMFIPISEFIYNYIFGLII